MTRFEEERRRAEASVRALPGWQERGLVIEPAIPVLASPSWRGVDGNGGFNHEPAFLPSRQRAHAGDRKSVV